MPHVREDQKAWEAVASFWHERMGEGNDFVDVLIWPLVKSLLSPLSDIRILDVGCGNGLFARKLAAEGARVTAVDYSASMISLAETATRVDTIDYHVLDAADPQALSTLPDEAFDAAIATMVLMDISEIEPLCQALKRVLRANGVFVFATAHPCFNSPHAQLEVGMGGPGTGAQVCVASYRSPTRTAEVAIRGQPAKTVFFHRSLSDLLRPAFQAGLVLDALEEAAFPPDHPSGSTPNSWGGLFHEFPPVMIGRLRASVAVGG